MSIVLLLTFVSVVIGAISVTHGLGFWLFLMVVHGALVKFLGDSAVHLPMYAGAFMTLIVLLRNRWRPIEGSMLTLFLCVVLIMCIAALAGVDQETSAEELFNYGKAMLLGIVVAGALRSVQDMRVMSLYLLASLIVGALLTLYQRYTGDYAVSSIYEVRAGGLRGDPNDTAMLLVAGVPVQIYWLVRARGLWKIPMAMGFVLLHIGIMLTGSRGGLVALLAIYALLYFRRPGIVSTILAVLLAGIALIAAPQSYQDRMMTLLTHKEAHGAASLADRQILLTEGLAIFRQHAALGVGTGNFGRAFIMDQNESSGLAVGSDVAAGQVGGVAHNMYLEFFVENGVIGGVAFLAILCFSVRGLARIREHSGAPRSWTGAYDLGYMLMTSMAGMLISGLFLSQGKNSVLWFLVGLGLATLRKPQPKMAAVPRTLARAG